MHSELPVAPSVVLSVVFSFFETSTQLCPLLLPAAGATGAGDFLIVSAVVSVSVREVVEEVM